jgi:hypothetical protein
MLVRRCAAQGQRPSTQGSRNNGEQALRTAAAARLMARWAAMTGDLAGGANH